jgi:hypothetical protein
MRTTLTIDDDVAIALERIRERGGLTLKAAVNEALRRGLRVLDAEAESKPRTPYRTGTWNGGPPKIDIANVVEALDWAEGPGRK